MALAKNLMGLGESAELASLEGSSDLQTVTGAGTTSVDATVMATAADNVLLAGAGNSGVRLPAGAALMHDYVFSAGANTVIVYPTVGGNMNGGTTDAGISVAAGKALICRRQSSTKWLSNLSA